MESAVGRGDQVKILCPFHDDHKPSCGVNLVKNVYHCFACGARGNALDFVAHMEEHDPNDASDLRLTALAAADIFNIDAAKEKPSRRPKVKASVKAKNGRRKAEKASKQQDKQISQSDASEAKNRPSADNVKKPAKQVKKPLSFELPLERKNSFKSRVKDIGLDKKPSRPLALGTMR